MIEADEAVKQCSNSKAAVSRSNEELILHLLIIF